MKEHQIGTVCELGGVEPLETNCEHILYLVRPTEEMMSVRCIARETCPISFAI